jgi:hypothetical protein
VEFARVIKARAINLRGEFRFFARRGGIFDEYRCCILPLLEIISYTAKPAFR